MRHLPVTSVFLFSKLSPLWQPEACSFFHPIDGMLWQAVQSEPWSQCSWAEKNRLGLSVEITLKQLCFNCPDVSAWQIRAGKAECWHTSGSNSIADTLKQFRFFSPGPCHTYVTRLSWGEVRGMSYHSVVPALREEKSILTSLKQLWNKLADDRV